MSYHSMYMDVKVGFNSNIDEIDKYREYYISIRRLVKYIGTSLVVIRKYINTHTGTV